MNWIEQVIAEFGRQIGMYDLRLGADGSIRFDLDDESSFGIIYNAQRNSNEVIVYRSTPVNYLGKMQYKEALGLSHFKKPRQWPLQATCNQKVMTLAFRIPERALMLSSLEKAITELQNSQKQIGDSTHSIG